jgi:activator of HSP90 ATPase
MQVVFFGSKPREVFECLMDSGKHTELTGLEAEISREIGGRISAFDGRASGENVELVRDRRIVQRWRWVGWPEGRSSLATIELEETKGGTKLTLVQTGVPDEEFETVFNRWYEYYWNPLKEMFGE